MQQIKLQNIKTHELKLRQEISAYFEARVIRLNQLQNFRVQLILCKNNLIKSQKVEEFEYSSELTRCSEKITNIEQKLIRNCIKTLESLVLSNSRFHGSQWEFEFPFYNRVVRNFLERQFADTEINFFKSEANGEKRLKAQNFELKTDQYKVLNNYQDREIEQNNQKKKIQRREIWQRRTLAKKNFKRIMSGLLLPPRDMEVLKMEIQRKGNVEVKDNEDEEETKIEKTNGKDQTKTKTKDVANTTLNITIALLFERISSEQVSDLEIIFEDLPKKGNQIISNQEQFTESEIIFRDDKSAILVLKNLSLDCVYHFKIRIKKNAPTVQEIVNLISHPEKIEEFDTKLISRKFAFRTPSKASVFSEFYVSTDEWDGVECQRLNNETDAQTGLNSLVKDASEETQLQIREYFEKSNLEPSQNQNHPKFRRFRFSESNSQIRFSQVIIKNTNMALSECGNVFQWGNCLAEMKDINNNTIISENISALFCPFDFGKRVVTKIFCGKSSCFALSSEMDLYSWGDNTKGQLGHPNIKALETPKQVVFQGSINSESIYFDFFLK